MIQKVLNEKDYQCPKCSGLLRRNIDVGDGYLYDLCGGVAGCGFKRKKNLKGQEVDVMGEVIELEKEDGKV